MCRDVLCSRECHCETYLMCSVKQNSRSSQTIAGISIAPAKSSNTLDTKYINHGDKKLHFKLNFNHK
jgi:hypothetical protein